MNEINKLYENAGIESEWRYTVHQFCHFYEADKEDILRNKYLFKERKTARIKKAEKKYPPFTAEKQIELIKWLCRTGHCLLRVVQYTDTDNWYMQTLENISSTAESFEESLVGLINNLWQDLTEGERKQIRDILAR